MSKLQDQELDLPAGFRFHPTDEELVRFYLCKKCSSDRIAAPVVTEIDLYKYDPWELPGMSLYGDKEWYFFSPRDRKYPNGSRPNRAAGTGYWKATGPDKPVGKPRTLAIKKALVFYAGKSPGGVKTNWIMHEYRLANVDRSAGKRNNLRLDDWVLCRIYNKKGTIEKHYISDHEGTRSSDSEEEERPAATATRTFLPIASPEICSSNEYASPEPKPRDSITSSPGIQQNFDFLMTYVEDEERPAAGTFLRDASPEMCSSNEYASPESNPREYISSSPEIQQNFDFLMNYDLSFVDDVVPFVPEMLYNDQLALFDEMFYMHQ